MEQAYCLPKYYANYNREAPRETNNYDELNINWNSVDDYSVFRKIGRGKYSDVFEAKNNKTSTMCVIKILKPVKKKKIFREIKILQNLQGGPNIIGLIDLIRDD
jgi:casein kinase II subunit alpha